MHVSMSHAYGCRMPQRRHGTKVCMAQQSWRHTPAPAPARCHVSPPVPCPAPSPPHTQEEVSELQEANAQLAESLAQAEERLERELPSTDESLQQVRAGLRGVEWSGVALRVGLWPSSRTRSAAHCPAS